VIHVEKVKTYLGTTYRFYVNGVYIDASTRAARRQGGAWKLGFRDHAEETAAAVVLVILV